MPFTSKVVCKISPSIFFFRLNALKDTSKAPTVDIQLRLNTSIGSKTVF